jgi:hypothetical protein
LEKGPVGKKDFLKKAKGKKGQPMADDNDPQPSSCNGTAHQNGQEKPAKKAKLEKGYPKAANKDPPQPSPINSTDQQNGQEKPAKEANLKKGHHKAANKDPLPSNGSEDDDKESEPLRPTQQDPYWLTNADVTPQVFYTFF